MFRSENNKIKFDENTKCFYEKKLDIVVCDSTLDKRIVTDKGSATTNYPSSLNFKKTQEYGYNKCSWLNTKAENVNLQLYVKSKPIDFLVKRPAGKVAFCAKNVTDLNTMDAFFYKYDYNNTDFWRGYTKDFKFRDKQRNEVLEKTYNEVRKKPTFD